MEDFKIVAIAEPAVVSFSARDDLGISRYDDGDVVITIGGNAKAPGESLLIPSHLVHAVGRALMDSMDA